MGGGGGLGQKGGGRDGREEGRKFVHEVTALQGRVCVWGGGGVGGGRVSKDRGRREVRACIRACVGARTRVRE